MTLTLVLIGCLLAAIVAVWYVKYGANFWRSPTEDILGNADLRLTALAAAFNDTEGRVVLTTNGLRHVFGNLFEEAVVKVLLNAVIDQPFHRPSPSRLNIDTGVWITDVNWRKSTNPATDETVFHASLSFSINSAWAAQNPGKRIDKSLSSITVPHLVVVQRGHKAR